MVVVRHLSVHLMFSFKRVGKKVERVGPWPFVAASTGCDIDE